MICTGVAAVFSEVLPLQRSYWVVLTVAIILKPDYGSVFARAVQRGVGTIIGAVLGAVIIALVPYGPWLLLPFGVLAALLPYGKSRSFGLTATFLTPFVVLLIDLLSPGGWRLAEERLIDTLIACAIVLLIGYAPWPSAWSRAPAAAVRRHAAGGGRLHGRIAGDRLGLGSASGRVTARDSAGQRRGRRRRRPPGGQGCGGRPSASLSNLRAEFQRTMSEPAPVSRRAAAWWPAAVGLEEVMDATTGLVVAIGRGAAPPGARGGPSADRDAARGRGRHQRGDAARHIRRTAGRSRRSRRSPTPSGRCSRCSSAAASPARAATRPASPPRPD